MINPNLQWEQYFMIDPGFLKPENLEVEVEVNRSTVRCNRPDLFSSIGEIQPTKQIGEVHQ